ncbi:hypothetical protein DDE82_008880 [Stemphylium lycopersici]|uniref:Uncharacterized protein n=1 Tax=Stemphylium lycopersici TaxID=183478 RepID=A0A364NAV3_STELY|nr:hypothetical protein TW65_03112 [Stemphylium lycopersici]RAQ98819.1 hypothetical protein DDE82_008880 [Stemphylium lycopersici]RAR14396.1 hypothetical protein DDE83_002164 [Stemphylium lycopersici]
MKSVFSLIAKQQPKTFKVSYAPDYKNFIVNHVATDPSHPLHETQKRRQAERKKEGLWWHATTGVDLNKSSCVRAWARRRLRNAIKEELRERGYDENGMFVDLKSVQGRPDLMNVLRAGKSLNLSGSLRLHVQPPLIPAKYADVRAETGHVIEAMLSSMRNGAGDFGSVRQTKRRPDFIPPRDVRRPPPKMRSQHVKQRVA